MAKAKEHMTVVVVVAETVVNIMVMGVMPSSDVVPYSVIPTVIVVMHAVVST